MIKLIILTLILVILIRGIVLDYKARKRQERLNQETDKYWRNND